MSEVIELALTTLSPIHIGCDIEYDPMSFVVDEACRRIVVFDPAVFFRELDEESRKRFSDICRKGTVGSIIEIYRFLRNRPAEGRPIRVSEGFLDHYDKTLRISSQDERRVTQQLNRFNIARTSFRPSDQRPYLPGSAIKGAIRTAYLSAISGEKRVDTPRGDYADRKLESILLDRDARDEIASDPFRMVKVSDFHPIGECGCEILYAVNQKKKVSKYEARGPFQILEVVKPGVTFRGRIVIETASNGSGISRRITASDLWQALVSFFGKERERENRELQTIGINPPEAQPDKGDVPIRVGRHSGAESVTIEGHRNIRIMMGSGKRPETKPATTTLWLASPYSKPAKKTGLLPFGWAALKRITEVEIEELEQAETAWTEEKDRAAKGPLWIAQEIKREAEHTGHPDQGKTRDEPIEVWAHALLTWDKGRQTLIAESDKGKTQAEGLESVPDDLREKLQSKKKKRKPVFANVTVKVKGPNYFEIVDVKAE